MDERAQMDSHCLLKVCAAIIKQAFEVPDLRMNVRPGNREVLVGLHMW